ncbi:11-beta-hydroxysteroid dehydrogenase 1B [Dichanthelium oligosanthes]|uniref:11-beta-hydroxysteroid dehydrogenase 1B n=1 Tax=Dichanthelium oligosanthes TaxID=888268 RepID=A0A1E5W1Y2_9POAL|nr:11-beta-hydroxysteroid dehydrogenase 1B [Dichanthelium oligosanthes]
MSKEAAVNVILSCFMHVGLALVLLVYLPVAFVCRLLARVFVRPFARGEDLRGKVVLVTGASSGIGEHLAYEYARKGACVALVARTEIALRAVAKTARDLGSPDVLVVPGDITKVDEAKRAVEETVAHFGKLNHLVANAGIWSSCFFEEITNITAFHNVMDLNFWGAVYPTYFALPYLKASRGNIVVTASVAGRVPTARMSFYNASKGAVIRFYETLRAELGSHVRVTILMPGYVVSNLTKGKGLQKDGHVGIDEEARDINVGPMPVGKTESLAEVVVASVRRGDYYVTWPGWYWPFHMVMCAAPELLDWFSRAFYVSKSGEQDGGAALSKKILEAVGGKKFLYPKTIRSQDAIAAN